MDQNRHFSQPSHGPIAWMAGHSVTANLLMLVLLIGGFMMGQHIKKEVFPDYDLDLITVNVPYPGASPEEVERGILLSIEERVRDIDGVKEVSATAREGAGTVSIEVVEGRDAQAIAQDVENEVGRITSFPEEAEEVKITVNKRRRFVVSLALYGDQGEHVLREMAETIRDRLLQDEQITQVDLAGIREYEISIEIPQDTLRAHGLTLEAVANTLRRAAVELPGGAVKTAAGDVLVRVKERRDLGREFARIPIITTGSGTQVLLENIAVIKDDFEESDQFAYFNGQPAVMLEVYRTGRQTPISVSDAVRKIVSELKQTLPQGLSIALRNDRSDYYRQRMDLMLRNGYLGLGLVFVLLALFLEARLAFWVSLGIPISFLGSLLILPAVGMSINIVSMFAFIVTLGIVVDDAIVAGENIYHHRQSGEPWLSAAKKGAREIAMPVVFSVLTNMVAFMPLFFIPGFLGKVFRQIPVVVICVFAVSLVESLLILPAHLAHQKHHVGKKKGNRLVLYQRRFSNLFIRIVRTRYGPFLSGCLRWRYVTLSISIAILVATIGYVKSGRMGFVLFPIVESDYAKATARLPFGAAVEKTMTVQDMLVRTANAVVAENGGERLVEGIYSRINSNIAEVYLYLTPPEERPRTTAQVTRLWRERTGAIPGLETLKFESDAGGPGRGAPIAVELSHRSMAILERASTELAEALNYYPDVVDIDDGFSPGKPQIDFKIAPAGRSLGLRSREVAKQVRHAYYGAEALRQQRGRNEIKVMVRLPKMERVSEYHLEQMILRTPAGAEIPLKEAVSISRGRAYTNIDRRNGRRVVTVSADVRPRKGTVRILTDLKANILPGLMQKYAGLTYSFEGRQADRRESMAALKSGMLVALVVIFAMLAIPLNSYAQPLIIMLAIPFGIVGAIVGHLIMGYSLSVISMFGVVALTGVVVNDSLVLIDFTNRRLRAGMAPFEAIHEATLHRFRPILLTTLTTFGGLTPMIFESSRQARFLIPMAISLGYGVLFATLITLLLVPCVFMVLEDAKGGCKRIIRP